MKKILSIAAILLLTVLVLCSCGSEEGYPKPTENFFVNDFADVISDSDEAEILSKAVALNDKTTAQVVTVTVESLDGKEPWEYALELGREWGVGTEEKDNGVVILLSESDREIYISVGYGLEGALPDSKTGRIIDVYGLGYLKQDDFSKGLAAIADAVINEVYIEYGIKPSIDYTPIANVTEGSENLQTNGVKVAISWIVMIIIVFVFLTIFSRRGKGFIWVSPGFFGGYRGGGFDSGRGGFGGGFSGGGGSFGGGGAGRGF